MTDYVATTDFEWFDFLRDRPDIEEANFWRPAASTAFHVLETGEPIIFKLKSRYGNKIVGFGTFVLSVNLPVGEAWTYFGQANGVATETEMWSRVGHYVRKLRGIPPPPNHVIGCLLGRIARVLPRDLWLDPPRDWDIVPYSHGGIHEVPNGLLLRADIHKLFDRGFVTVTPDYRFKVSRLLDEQYQNGRAYYQLEGSDVWVPEHEADRPRKEYLEMHSSKIFLG